MLQTFSKSQLIVALPKLLENPDFAEDCLARGQIRSKLWIVDELKKLDLNLGTVFICGGWYATLATMLFEQDFDIKKVRSFDIDSSCWKIAETFNKPWVMKEWKFKSCTQDIHDINYDTHVYNVNRSDGSICELTDSPDTIINTSCEHIENFNEWYFICATYNPNINEQGSQVGILDPDYWNNNIEDNGTAISSGIYTYNSGFGNRSKVEIISKTQLLTARGYKV